MIRTLKFPVLLLLLLLGAITARAEQTYRLEVGELQATDTYLSPLKYSGPQMAFTGQWEHQLPSWSSAMSMQFDCRLEGAVMDVPSKKKDMYEFATSFHWGLWYGHTFPCRLSLAGGAALGFDVGALYLPNNGNNPATALANFGLDLRVRLSYPFKIKNFGMTVTDECSLPTVSAFFRQGYGESYYEIYLGNHHNLVHCGWWGNHFGLDNLLSLNLHFKKRDLQVGYRFRVHDDYVNHLNRQTVGHAFVVGVTF